MGIITPPLIIGATLAGDWLPYLISMSLLASALALFAVQSGMASAPDDLHAGHQFCLPRRDGGRRDVGKARGGGI